ncbi:protein ATP6V1FNB-like [Homalodisca vitripennis]|uniref:protein ATP6V1FNB-like n=1 Tax=Homalodisca vitripennis TaxID=197043 RepID=UPI001EEC8F0E|nr:protein ATP6V1FNB-like [Homalodisca vitripennis]
MASKSAIAIAELRAQAVAKEMERKQNLMRLKWFEQNYEKVFKNPALPKEKIPKKAAVLYEELRKMRKERFKAEREAKTKPCATIDEKDIDIEAIMHPMYPVPQEIKETLYNGISHYQEGRYKYLKLRNKSDPHEKFRHKETYGFEYGWRIRETAQPPKKDFCRRTTWYRRMNGAMNVGDPARRPPNPSGQVISFPFL